MELLGLHRGAALQDPAEEPGAGPRPRLRGVADRGQREDLILSIKLYLYLYKKHLFLHKEDYYCCYGVMTLALTQNRRERRSTER